MNRSLLAVCAALVLAGSGLLVWFSTGGEPAIEAPRAPEARSAVPSSSRSVRVAEPAPPPGPVPGKSPEQERLEQRRWLYEMVDSLLVNREIDRARKYLDEGLARYGEDAAPEWRDLDVGYRLIADCLEEPDVAKHKVRARAFVGVTEARGLIPKIRAACGP